MKSLRSIMGLTKFIVFDDGLLQQLCVKLFSNRRSIITFRRILLLHPINTLLNLITT